jgi:TPR repeat protein
VLTVPATLEARCKVKKDPGSCYELGDFYRQTSQPAVIAQGTALLLYGCELEKKRPCAEAEAEALAAINVKGRQESDAKAEAILQALPAAEIPEEKACREGDAEACDKAGIHYQFLGPVLNRGKAKGYYEEGCRLGHQGACSTLELLRKGIIRVFDVQP